MPAEGRQRPTGPPHDVGNVQTPEARYKRARRQNAVPRKLLTAETLVLRSTVLTAHLRSMGTLIGLGLLLALTGEAYAQRRGFGAQLPGMGRSASVNPMPPARLRPQIPTGGAGGRAPIDSHGSGSGFSNDVVVPYV